MKGGLEPFGDVAWRAPLAAGSDRRAVLGALRLVPRVVDAIVSEHHALVTFRAGAPPDDDAVTAALSSRESEHVTPREHLLRLAFDGPDLDEVARATGMQRDAVVSTLTSPTYVVAMLGFQPGFGYLRGLDARLMLPRRATARTRVAAFSLGIAGPYAGVYPFDSPGGWNLVGTAVGFRPFDAQSGAALALGDHVRFVAEPSPS